MAEPGVVASDVFDAGRIYVHTAAIAPGDYRHAHLAMGDDNSVVMRYTTQLVSDENMAEFVAPDYESALRAHDVALQIAAGLWSESRTWASVDAMWRHFGEEPGTPMGVKAG